LTHQTYRIGDCCRIVKGVSHTLKTEAGEYPLVVTADFRRTSSTYQLEGPAVCVPLVSSTGHGHAAIHRIHYQEGRFALANLLVALLPKDPKICNAKYLYYLLTAKKDEYFVPLMAGTANVSLSDDDISDVEVSLPSSEVQERIVTHIQNLTGAIEKAKQLKRQCVENTRHLFDAVRSEIFARGRDIWPAHVLADCVTDDRYGTSARATEDSPGIPIIRMINIQDGHLDLGQLKYLHLNEQERRRLLLSKGDLLVNRTNSAELVGKCAVFDAEGDYGFASYLIRLRLDLARVDPEFVALYVNSPIGRAYMLDERKQMTGQANVNATKLKAMPIAIPSLPEQNKIVSYLSNLRSKLDALSKLQSQTQSELDGFLSCVLGEIFS
jgi:restriction endonuclease S subunit